jgi:hypothetical protein
MALGRDYNGTGNAFYNEQVEKRSRERGTIEWRDDFNPHGAIPSSHDVDIFWLEHEDEETLQQALRALRDAVQLVAQKNGLGLSWLNYLTQLLLYDQVHIPKGRLWRRYGPLHLYIPPKEYILALKFLAGREKDIEDCRILLPQTKVKTRRQARRLLERYVFPDAQTKNAEQIENTLDELFGKP